jgi:hypothetical protein
LLTTIGTLVVAVSGFYFGSTTASAATQDRRRAEAPRVTSVSPAEGIRVKDAQLRILGENFAINSTARLERGGEAINCQILSKDPGQISGRFNLETASLGTWDVVVKNPDGSEARLPNGFKVIERPQASKDSPATPQGAATQSPTAQDGEALGPVAAGT